MKLLNILNNSDVLIKEDSLNGATEDKSVEENLEKNSDAIKGVYEDKSVEIVEHLAHLENNSGEPIKEDSLNGVTEYKSDEIIEHLENNSDAQIKEDSLNGVT